MNKKQTGNFAEFMARVYLRLKGYHILEKNYITGRGTTAGEIDIIALKKMFLFLLKLRIAKHWKMLFMPLNLNNKNALSMPQNFIWQSTLFTKNTMFVLMPYLFQVSN